MGNDAAKAAAAARKAARQQRRAAGRGGRGKRTNYKRMGNGQKKPGDPRVS